MKHRVHDVGGLPIQLVRQLDADPFWTDGDRTDAERATQFGPIADIATRVAARMPQPLSIVCGPIRSGGLGNAALNLERFMLTIRLLRAQGWSVFNQMPCERHFWRIEQIPGRRSEDILDVFYGHLFRSGLIRQMAFMPGWRKSFGASWEHDQARKLLIPVVYLYDPFVLRPSS